MPPYIVADVPNVAAYCVACSPGEQRCIQRPVTIIEGDATLGLKASLTCRFDIKEDGIGRGWTIYVRDGQGKDLAQMKVPWQEEKAKS